MARKTVRQELRETEKALTESLGQLRMALDAVERWRQLAEMRLVNLEHIRDSHDTRLANIERSAERLAQYVDGSMNTTATPVPRFEGDLPY